MAFSCGWIAGGSVWGQAVLIPGSDSRIQYFGRYDWEDPAGPGFIWGGNQIVARFTGTSVGVQIQENFGNNGRYYAFIDEDFASPVLLSVGNSTTGVAKNNAKTDYTLASGLAPGEHTVRLVRLGDYYKSQTTFFGFRVNSGESLVAPPATPQRRIEFWGDSITEGTYQQTAPDPNPWIAWGAKTARNLGAAYTPVSRSGLGLFKGYQLPATMKTLSGNTTSGDKTPRWDFLHEQYNQPHVLVINIGQNDFWTALSTPTADLVNHYTEMLSIARAAMPDSAIILANGGMSMGSFTNPEAIRWRSAMDTAAAGFSNVYRYNIGEVATNGHPQDAESTIMAAGLTDFINNSLPASVWSSIPTIPRVEAETARVTGISRTVEVNGGAHGGATLRGNATAAGQSLSLSIDSPGAGLYFLRVWLRRDRDHGIVDVFFNGQQIADDLDTYRGTDSQINFYVPIAAQWNSDGIAPATLEVRSVAKSSLATSSTFAFGIDSIEFIRSMPVVPEPGALMGMLLPAALLARRGRS